MMVGHLRVKSHQLERTTLSSASTISFTCSVERTGCNGLMTSGATTPGRIFGHNLIMLGSYQQREKGMLQPSLMTLCISFPDALKKAQICQI
ncbi:hypothetical protein I7I50_10439 [Histoplasma capsulatum G186AR]|uniref:Uncharacterized protein n=1 Tax=Ajellomyces capsulatus TaxID=5037 RepID=A0A8H7Z8B8_AJECA|nr:hypothetical protein I7I52_01678 [Histoplasma capsulatum]QSS69224.1 hypothetical protein I7I50_10439 [Histoplasma capsulatum G186AR]